MINYEALLLTIILEFIVLLVLKKNYKYLIISIILNIMTNIPLNLFLTEIINLLPIYYLIILIIFEISIIFIESIGYYLLNKKFCKSLKISFYLNFISFFIGTIIYNFII